MTTSLALPAQPALPALSSIPTDISTDISTDLASVLRTLRSLRRRLPTVVLFAAVSFSSWTLDYALALALNSVTGSVLLAVVGARLVSCTVSFLLNRRLFQASPETFMRSAFGYAAVQGTTTTTSYLAIAVLTWAGVPLWLAKILADSSLFGLNYLLQSRLVYRSGSPASCLGIKTAAA